MSIIIISGYKFIALSDLLTLHKNFNSECEQLKLKGTILLSSEGINLNLSGESKRIANFKKFLQTDERFQGMHFNENYISAHPFKRLKIKIKKEIITFRQSNLQPNLKRAPSITPEILKTWLDENRDFILVDTRNEQEIKFGTFVNAMHLNLKTFCDFPHAMRIIPHDKPIVTFCTGGIRCEKAALFMLQNGFKNVFQLEGGILNYFQKIGSHYYEGQCFVFDERIVVDNENPQNMI